MKIAPMLSSSALCSMNPRQDGVELGHGGGGGGMGHAYAGKTKCIKLRPHFLLLSREKYELRFPDLVYTIVLWLAITYFLAKPPSS